LNNYKHTDFANFWQSRLLKNAAHYGRYKNHLELFTPASYQSYLDEMKKDTSRYIIWYKQEFYQEVRKITNGN
ncbi:MAG: hypothetical protein LRY55_15545, partial [Leadbetterella sp.]|nr:hypothetical protein [Leadbetterella sp.]